MYTVPHQAYRASILISALVVIILAVPTAIAQVDTGNTPFGTFQNGPIDSVNLGNLNVELNFPIISKPGRATTFNYSLTYDSSVWIPKPSAFGIYAGINDPFWLMSSNVGWNSHYPKHGNHLMFTYEYNLSCGAGGSGGQAFDGNVQHYFDGVSNQQVNYTADGVPTDFTQLLDYSGALDYLNSANPDPGCNTVMLNGVINGFSYVDINGVPRPFSAGTYIYYNVGDRAWTAVGFPATAADGSGYQLNVDTSTLPNPGTVPSGQQVYSIISPGGTNIASFPQSQVVPAYGSLATVMNSGGGDPDYFVPDRNGNTVANPTFASIPPYDGTKFREGPLLDLNTYPVDGVGALYHYYDTWAAPSLLPVYNPPTSVVGETYNDDSGQPIITFGYSTNVTASNVIPTDATFQKTYSYIDESGTSRQYMLHYKYYNIATNFNCSGIQESNNGSANLALASTLKWSLQPSQVGPWSIANMVRYFLVDYLMLPDGRQYQFTYESTPGQSGYVTARIASVTLPSGGSVSYSYGPVNCADGSTLSLTRSVSDANGNVSRWVYERSQNGAIWTTSIQDPEQNASIYQFIEGYPAQTAYGPAWTVTPTLEVQATQALALQSSLPPIPPSFYEIVHRQFQGSSQLLREADTCYNGNCTSPTSVTYPILERSITTLLSSTTGNAVSTTTDETYTTVGSLASSSTTDFSGNGISETNTNYQWFGPVERPVTTEKNNFQGQEVLSINYYDEPGTIVPTNNIPYHVSGFNYGNPTSTSSSSHFLGLAGPAFIKTKSCKYYDTGKVQSCEDGDATNGTGGSLTTYTYDTTTGGMLLSASATNPDGSLINGVSHTTQYSYDPNTRNLIGTYDQNNQRTTFGHDMFSRLVHIGYPDGGSTSYCYSDLLPSGMSVLSPASCTGGSANSVEVTNQYSPNKTSITITQNDGLGRPIQGQMLGSSLGTIYQDTFYDSLGNVSKTSNPYYSSADTTYGLTTTYHDALGRITATVAPDGSLSSMSYSGNAAAYTDAALNTTTRTSDALGRLIQVVEANQAVTNYSYDVNSNLTSAVQLGVVANGDEPRTRHFFYDGLSRLITSTNPETGTICYGTVPGGGPPTSSNCSPNGYDANGNLIYKTDARGITTMYAYDALNRLTQKTHWDGTPGSFFTYDTWTAWGQAPTNAIGRLAYETNNVNANNIFSYDAMGRITRMQGCVPDECNGGSHITTAGYDLAGHMTNLTYPDGRQLSQSWDAAGRLSSVNVGPPGSATPYWTANSYFPDGSLHSVAYGNGTSELRSENSRLQTCELSLFMPPAIGGTQVFDHQYFFGHGGSGTACSPTSGNNGNISQIVDNTNPAAGSNARNQTFGYDSLNRLNSWSTPSMAGSARGQIYGYDSFGNISQTNGVNMPNFSPGYDANNRMQSLGCGTNIYDLAGNVLCQGMWGVDAQSYLYDAESRVTQVQAQSMGTQFNLAAQYTYDAEGNRVRKDLAPFSNQNYTEYVYFGGQPIAEKDQSGNWTDYVYAGGQKIAKLPPADARVHTHGVFTASGNELRWNLPVPQNANGGWYTVKSGDMLCFRQYNAGAVGGPLIGYNNGQWTAWQWADTNGVTLNQDTLQNTWHNRCTDLTMGGATTGSNLQLMSLLTDIWTGPGTWDIWYADMAITSSDGTVTQIIGAQPPWPAYGDFQGGAWTGTPTAYAETVPSSLDPTAASVAGVTAHYYIGDHLGTTQMEFASGGWPLWQGSYAPFGQQVLPGTPTDFVGPLPADGTAMHYKFTGKERDSESGLDYFGARYYASGMGRWMSPDWESNPQAVPYASYANPQSLNLYNYMLNNPLGGVDADGHWPSWQDIKDVGVGIGKAVYNATVVPTSMLLNATVHLVDPQMGSSHSQAMQADGDMQAAGMQAGTRIMVAASVIDVAAAASVPLETTGASISAILPEEGQTVYRVWGDQSGPYGHSWSPVNPDSVPNFRDAAGLPDVNSGTQVTTGILTNPTGVTARPALPLDGNQGGAPEYLVPNPQQQIQIKSIQDKTPPDHQ